jgi:hypothetical protein
VVAGPSGPARIGVGAVLAMTSEIVHRLLLAAKPEELASVFTLTVVRCSLLREAADEIVALLNQVEDMQVELDQVRDDHDEMLAMVDYLSSERGRLHIENMRLRGLA